MHLGGQTRRRLLSEAGAAAALLGVARAGSAVAATSHPVQTPSPAAVRGLEREARSRYARNGDVRIHYMVAGRGPLLLFVHGFPGWWWTWRHYMAAFADRYTVVAMDLRGYNLSDRPAGAAHYDPVVLRTDLQAVIEDAGFRSATVIGHDWGGGLAWVLGFLSPTVVDRLVVMNVPHPWALMRELSGNPAQAAAAAYARALQRPDVLERPMPELGGRLLTAEAIATVLAPPTSPDFPRHLAAMRRTDLRAAVDYYVAGYPKEPYEPAPGPPPKVKAPTLLIWGRDDPFLLIGATDGTWAYVDAPLHVELIPHAGHFVQNDARAAVLRTIGDWLAATPVG